MSPESHQKVRRIFDEALERPEAERTTFVRAAAAGDTEVYEAVSRLLGARNDSSTFLEDPPTHRSTRIDRYLIKGELGRGAMGTVYEGVDPIIGRTVAIKVLSLETKDPKEAATMRESLFREARSCGLLSHPGIVTVFDVGQEGEEAFIAMELVDGPTLQSVLDDGGIADPAVIRDILRQAAAALDYAHRTGVIHRDVKPANIMLHQGNMVKITDFGIAKIASSQYRTATGMVMGTPAFMSPEQIEMKPLDGRSDQFALALVTYELLTGAKPFPAQNLPMLLQAVVYGSRPSARAANPSLPARVDAIFERAFQRDPAERYPTCTEFADALEAAFVPVAVAAPPPPLPAPPPPRPAVAVPVPVTAPPSRSKLPVILIFCMALLALAGGGFFVLRNFIPKILKKSSSGAPVVVQFVAEPASIEAGSSSTLRWAVNGATEVTIDEGVGTVEPSGSRQVSPARSTTYLLFAKGAGGNSTARVDIEVTAPASKPSPIEPLPPAPPPKTLPPPVETADSLYQQGREAQRAGMPSKAVPLFRSSAQKGDVRAMDALGQLYLNGFGVAKDYAEALRWFGQAAAGGNPSGAFHLGSMYDEGLGVDRNPSEALSNYRKAAAAGNQEAVKRLAELETRKSEPAPPAAALRKIAIRVAANQPWVDTGLDLRPGERVEITATGTVRPFATTLATEAPPKGLLANCSTASTLYGRPAGPFPAPLLPCWSLIARVGSRILEVGEATAFTMNAGARLFLGINDDNVTDNTGTWTAIVTVTPVGR